MANSLTIAETAVPHASMALVGLKAAARISPLSSGAANHRRPARRAAASLVTMQQQPGMPPQELVGEDAGVFDLSAQKLISWVQFAGVFTVVFGALFVLWLYPSVPPSSLPTASSPF